MAQSLETVKKEVRSVLLTYPQGVSLEEFIRTYKNLLAARLPSREFGFTTPIDFLHSIPDVVHIEMDRNGTYQLRALANKDTEHIQKLVQKQRTTKPNNKSNSSISRNRQNGFVQTNVSTTKRRPFVPAVMRAEIIEVVKQYPEGIGYLAFITAYQKMFNRTPNFCFLSDILYERFQQLANAVPELEVKMVNRQEKLVYVPQNSPRYKPTAEEMVGKFARLQPLIVKNKSSSSNEIKDVSAIPSHMKYNIEKILKKHPEGILAIHFPILYEDFTKIKFELHELGYNHLLDFVDALPDIFRRVKSTENSNDWKLFHISFSDNIAEARKPGAMANTHSQKPTRISQPLMQTRVEMAPAGLQFSEPELPRESRDKFFPVFVSAFIDPHLFWFQVDEQEANEKFHKLQKDIENFYNAQMQGKYKMDNSDILIGSTCVAFFSEDNLWYRCVITALLNTEDVKVLFVDYGSWETIPRRHLYYLKYSFMLLPKQAFQGRLAFVQPSNPDGTWENSAKLCFLELSNKRFIMARVHSMQDKVASLFLCDVSGDEHVYINDALVSASLAEYSSSDESELAPLSSSALSEDPSPAKSIIKIHSSQENCTMNLSSIQNGIANGYSKPEPTQVNVTKKLKALQLSKNQRSVRRILLGDGYCIHILIADDTAFVSAEDLCHLLWKDEGADVLACRLDFKDVEIPKLTVCKEKYANLFEDCERYKVGGFTQTDENYSVVLYPLKYTIKVLNVFGHHSVNVRKTLLQEIQEFNPHASVWSQSQVNGECYENLPCGDKSDLDKLCIYDLTVMREALECKRIKELEEICLQYTYTE
ncbi:hypothetical protein JTE90_009388 [Oedothorax gibbosus]|uniref:Tudor domain-containing protein 5 n=1 Tax=Oedothorax gibbosus TaxID=931172 RepID=A0AAV6VUU2_9ARAC|nr:hypothetical protein JTE90_009388 [Oedothorax gibbosus]